MKITFRDILEARTNVGRVARKTPFAYAAELSERTGGEVYLKLESQQITGSFKLRGASNKISRLTEEERARGIVTASAGNHAQGVAYVSRALGVDALIVIPENAPQTKIKNTRRLGAQVMVKGKDYDDSARIAHELEKETGRIYVHAFEDPYIMAGQGTLGYEMMEAHPDLDIVLVPVGGGGLMTGVATAVHAMNPATRVIGIQPETSRPWYEAFKQKRFVDIEIGDSWADGLTGEASEAMVEDFIQIVDDMYALDEESIQRGIYYLADQEHLIVEGSGAVGISLLLDGKLDIRGKKVGIVVTGGNLDTAMLRTVLETYGEK